MEYREDLKAYLDGELPAARAEAIRKAAETDSELKREIDALRTISSTLTGIKRDYAPSGLEQTLSALGGRPGSLSAPAKRKSWLGYGAGLALAAAVALIYAVPSLFNRPRTAARSLVTSYDRAAAQANQPMQTRPLRNGPVDYQNFSAHTVAPIAKPAPSLQDQLNDEKAKVQLLQKQVDQLKTSVKVTGQPILPLPAPPALSGGISPNGATVVPEGASEGIASKAVSPERIAALESQVRKLATAAGGRVEASGPSILRALSITIDASKATALAGRIRSALKDAGTVSQEPAAAPAEDERTQSVEAKIVDLKVEREKLLSQFLPEAPQVQELNQEIEILQASIKSNTKPPQAKLKVSIG